MFSCHNSEKTIGEDGESTTEIQIDTPALNLYDLDQYVTDVKRSKNIYMSVFGFELVEELKSIILRYYDEIHMIVEFHGLYLVGNNGMHPELIQKTEPNKRRQLQNPINHFTIEVEHVRKEYELAISMVAKPALEDNRL